MQQKENVGAAANEPTRQALLANLKKSKIFDQLRAGMRQEFFAQMQPGGAGARKKVQSMAEDRLLEYRVAVGLVLEFLMRNDFVFSQSVVVPESGLGDSILRRAELEDILNLRSAERRVDSSLLASLVGELRNRRVLRDCCEVECQTDMGEAGLTLDEKLRRMELKFSDKLAAERMMPFKTMEERMVKYKREVDDRARAEVAAEVASIREVEVAAARLEEQSRQRKSNAEFRAQLERLHHDKISELKLRERETVERMQLREKQLESAAYEHRQSVLKDYEQLKAKEAQLRAQVEVELKTVKLERERLSSGLRELELKQKEVERVRALLDSQCKEDLEQFKREYERAHDDQRLRLREKRLVLEDEEHRVRRTKESLEAREQDHVRTKTQLAEVEDDYARYKKKTEKTGAEVEQLREQLRMVSETARREQELAKQKEAELTLLKERHELTEQARKTAEMTHKESLAERNQTIAGLKGQLKKKEESQPAQARMAMESAGAHSRLGVGAGGGFTDSRLPRGVEPQAIESLLLETGEEDVGVEEFQTRMRRLKNLEQESDILRRKKRALLQPESVEDDLRCFTNAFDPPKPNDERLASKAFVKMEREHRNTFQSSGAPSPYAAGRGGGHADTYGVGTRPEKQEASLAADPVPQRHESAESHTIGDILEPASSVKPQQAGAGAAGLGRQKDESEDVISEDYEDDLFREF